jgi:hypothetical protein
MNNKIYVNWLSEQIKINQKEIISVCGKIQPATDVEQLEEAKSNKKTVARAVSKNNPKKSKMSDMKELAAAIADAMHSHTVSVVDALRGAGKDVVSTDEVDPDTQSRFLAPFSKNPVSVKYGAQAGYTKSTHRGDDVRNALAQIYSLEEGKEAAARAARAARAAARAAASAEAVSRAAATGGASLSSTPGAIVPVSPATSGVASNTGGSIVPSGSSSSGGSVPSGPSSSRYIPPAEAANVGGVPSSNDPVIAKVAAQLDIQGNAGGSSSRPNIELAPDATGPKERNPVLPEVPSGAISQVVRSTEQPKAPEPEKAIAPASMSSITTQPVPIEKERTQLPSEVQQSSQSPVRRGGGRAAAGGGEPPSGGEGKLPQGSGEPKRPSQPPVVPTTSSTTEPSKRRIKGVFVTGSNNKLKNVVGNIGKINIGSGDFRIGDTKKMVAEILQRKINLLK